MAVVMVSEAILREFVEGAGGREFEAAVEAQFQEADEGKKGHLSRAELGRALELLSLSFMDVYDTTEPADPDTPSCLCMPAVNSEYDAVFAQFDADGDGVVGASEFKVQIRHILLAIAHGLRGCPLSMILQQDSLLSHAVKHERGCMPTSQKS